MTDEAVSNSLLLKKVNTSVDTYYGETSVKAKETVFVWTIRNASKLYMPAGKHCSSPHFSVNFNGNYTRWTLHYFPGGCDELAGSFASLELCEHVYEGEEKLELYAKFSVVDASKIERVKYQNFISPNNLLRNVVTIPKFINKTNISDFIVNGNLKIICRLYSDTKVDCSSVTPNLCNSLENRENENELAAVLNNFEKLLDGSKLSDVKLATSTREFPAHKAILSARSRVFAAMFEHDMKENATNVVSITDIDEEVIQVMLKFIYTSKVDNLESMADRLWIAADKYELNALKTICEKVLLTSLSDKTIVDILIFVDRYNAEELRDSAIEFVTMHANELSLNENFNATMKILSPSLLALVIKDLMSVA